jgi:hypothetical protein
MGDVSQHDNGISVAQIVFLWKTALIISLF